MRIYDAHKNAKSQKKQQIKGKFGLLYPGHWIWLVWIVLAGCTNTNHQKLSPLDVIELGDGWATNTVNTVIFRHHALVSRGGFQFTSYYGPKGELRVVRRDLSTNEVQTHEIPGQYDINDAHNSISLGIDKLGFLHISYDHHVSPLHYRRSLKPLEIDRWSEELPMTGVREDNVTYPSFLMPAGKNKQGGLLFLYRYGSSSNGDACIKVFDDVNGRWSDLEPCILMGSRQRPWSSGPYWNHPVFDNTGRLHLSFVWRTHSLGKEKIINNINVDYAVSEDWGRTWRSSKGRRFRLPITQVNSETVYTVSPGTNLINQTSSAVDTQGNPHIVLYSNDPDDVPQYQHIWFDGKQWQHNFISKRTKPFLLAGGGTLGTLQIPISRPEIVIDDADNVYVIYRGDLTGNRMAVQRLTPPNYIPSAEMRILWEEPVEYSEPVIDRIRWQTEGVLSMLIQKNGQPSHDAEAPVRVEPVYIVDWNLVGNW